MTTRVCLVCHQRQTQVDWARRDLSNVARKLAAGPDEAHEPRLRAALGRAQLALAQANARLEAHQADCTFEPDAPRRVVGTMSQRRRKPKPPKVKPRVPREALLEAIAEADQSAR